MLFVPFATRNGSNQHFAKTNMPLACCLRTCPGGPFFLGPAQNAPTRIGSGRLTNCGCTSTTASRQRPANASLMSKPIVNNFLTSRLLANNRRLLFVNNFSTNKPLVTAKRLLFAKAFLTSVSHRNDRWGSVLPCVGTLKDGYLRKVHLPRTSLEFHGYRAQVSMLLVQQQSRVTHMIPVTYR